MLNFSSTPKTPHIMPKRSCWLRTCQRGSQLSHQPKQSVPGLKQSLQRLDDQIDTGGCTEPIPDRQGSSVHSPDTKLGMCPESVRDSLKTHEKEFSGEHQTVRKLFRSSRLSGVCKETMS